jgi:hypothetical protein
MASFTALRSNFTPSVTADNWTVNQPTTGAVGKIEWISWGGNLGSSGSYRTRWARPTAAGSTITALTLQGSNLVVSAAGQAASTWTTQPTLPSEPTGLFSIAWNPFGGAGILTLPAYSGWMFVGGASSGGNQISCRNDAGTDAGASSYGVQWAE